MNKITKTITDFRFILAIYFTLTLAVSIHNFLLSDISRQETGYTHYNNYLIFKQSFFHLMEGKNLYEPYSGEYFDLFKYSPTFALFFGGFAFFPDWLGLALWNILNVLLLFFGFKYLPSGKKQKAWMLYFVLLELITSVQNSQSNGLMAGLLILAFVFLERKNYMGAIFLIVFSGFIKIFGLAALLLLLFYPNKIRAALYTVGWIVILGLLPVLILPLEMLIRMYWEWLHMLTGDYSASLGYSVMGWLNSWFGLYPDKILLLTLGAFLLFLPLIRWNKFKNLQFRLLFLASLLIWVVIFNHKAESPTFVIAMSGIAIWGFTGNMTLTRKILLIVAFVLTSLTATDLFPPTIRGGYIEPYVIKAVSSIVIWALITYELLFNRFNKLNHSIVNNKLSE
ncbi:MAG: DUF2029 domain-containing protein [Bacteroidales bacterium]|nr:DUF2029 domain-containing protein [Bacteroidales bacterium]